MVNCDECVKTLKKGDRVVMVLEGYLEIGDPEEGLKNDMSGGENLLCWDCWEEYGFDLL